MSHPLHHAPLEQGPRGIYHPTDRNIFQPNHHAPIERSPRESSRPNDRGMVQPSHHAPLEQDPCQTHQPNPRDMLQPDHRAPLDITADAPMVTSPTDEEQVHSRPVFITFGEGLRMDMAAFLSVNIGLDQKQSLLVCEKARIDLQDACNHRVPLIATGGHQSGPLHIDDWQTLKEVRSQNKNNKLDKQTRFFFKMYTWGAGRVETVVNREGGI